MLAGTRLWRLPKRRIRTQGLFMNIHRMKHLGPGIRAEKPVAALFACLLASCQSMPHHAAPIEMTELGGRPSIEAVTETYEKPYSANIGELVELDQIADTLASARVLYVGEVHDRFDHHLNQLEIIKAMRDRYQDVSIGVEFFQRPFQEHLDAYVRGEIDEREMLKRTEYFSHWSLDYRQYRPILRYAREQGIPLVALDVATELRTKAGRQGLDSFTDEEKARIPVDMDRDNDRYRQYIRQAFEQMHQMPEERFEHFLQAQILREETMAESIARYLQDHPQHRMVALAGFGHFIYGIGVPDRVQRRMAVDDIIVLQGLPREITPDMGDYVLFPKSLDLPPAGKMGIWMEDGREGVSVTRVSENSPAAAADIRAGDLLLAVDDEAVRDMADVKVIMLDKGRGEAVSVKISRQGWFGSRSDRLLWLTLQ